jgi:hypothetical protein
MLHRIYSAARRRIIDVPFFDIPDYTSGKKDMIYSTEDVLENNSE